MSSISRDRTRRYVYRKTKKEALAKVVALQDKNEKGVPAGPTKLTVDQFLTEWLDHIKLHVRPQTWAGYESNVRVHLKQPSRRSAR